MPVPGQKHSRARHSRSGLSGGERSWVSLSSHLVFRTHRFEISVVILDPASPASTSGESKPISPVPVVTPGRQPAMPVSTGRAGPAPGVHAALDVDRQLRPDPRGSTTDHRGACPPTSQTTYSVPSPAGRRAGRARCAWVRAPPRRRARRAHSSSSRTSMTRSPRSSAAAVSTMLTSIGRQPFTFALFGLTWREEVLTASNADAGIRLSWSSSARRPARCPRCPGSTRASRCPRAPARSVFIALQRRPSCPARSPASRVARLEPEPRAHRRVGRLADRPGLVPGRPHVGVGR